ncbi:hypothetical protein LshimejAT787_1600460 [Lyophyllum shimeji]|uniref:Uncharacterized protein n=1 Tax=Lyophyllum shimeji TaxID=47721 RepID=A0A9P3PZT0_LYOSH|nr:hypothetical protein LshimejAT787_1600460 [Lyophyllum shimeji]
MIPCSQRLREAGSGHSPGAETDRDMTSYVMILIIKGPPAFHLHGGKEDRRTVTGSMARSTDATRARPDPPAYGMELVEWSEAHRWHEYACARRKAVGRARFMSCGPQQRHGMLDDPGFARASDLPTPIQRRSVG